ncbi:phosphoribosylamine--glycine ligase [Guggenheimella bovis]
MNILLIGSGAREHAIYEKLKRAGAFVKAMPGNAGMDQRAMEEPLSTFLDRETFDLVFFGPEVPLSKGEADLVRLKKKLAFGPGLHGALLETSKVFSKEFMKNYEIPCAESFNVETKEELLEKAKAPCVLKADGLAAGKGVLIIKNEEDLIRASEVFFEECAFGDAGKKVLVEELLEGPEVSLFYLVNDKGYYYLGNARDHKRAYDNDEGPNTGGMGAVTPVSLTSKEDQEREEIIRKTFEGLHSENISFRGVLFIGCMRTKDGLKVLEYNVRFGDPETQAVLENIDDETFLDLVVRTAKNEHYPDEPLPQKKHTVCVVIASEGYPVKNSPDEPITIDPLEDVKLFYAGVKDEGGLKSHGGRIFSLVASASSLEEARAKCYREIDKIHFKGARYRRDIGR